VVSVSPRQRVRSQADVVRLLLALFLVGAGVLASSWLRNTLGGAEEDLVEVYQRVPAPFAEVLTGLAVAGTVVVPVVVLVVLMVRKRFRQVGALLLGSVGAGAAMWGLTTLLADQGVVAAVDPSTDRVVEFADPTIATSPLLAAAVALVVIASTWLSLQWRRALWAGVAVLMLFRVVSSSEAPLDIVISLAVGLAAGSLTLLLFGAESSDPEAPELLTMLRRVGTPRRVVQHPGINPLTYEVELVDGQRLEMRLRTEHDRSAELLEQLWRSLRLRTWVTDQPYDTVQQRIEHEALAQVEAAAGGVRVATLRRVVASPHGSVGLVEDHVDGTVATDLPADRLTRQVLVDIWQQVDALHRQGIAHRSLSLAEVVVTEDGTAVLRGFDGARLAAPERDLALDRAQLLVSTALVVGPQKAIAVASDALGHHAVAAAVPYLQPLALPTTTRRAWRADKEVLDGLRDAVRTTTGVELPPLARLDRIRPRTAVSIAVVTAAFYLLLPQLADVGETAEAAADANWWWLLPIVIGAGATLASAAVAIVASVPEPVPYLPALRMQFAASFVGRIAPANTGSLAVAVRFLQRSGLDTGAAAAGVGLNALVGFGVHLTLMAGFIAWTGTRGVGFSLPEANNVFIALAVALSAVGLSVTLVPALRRRVVPPVVQQLRTAVSALGDVLTDPVRVVTLLAGSMGVTISFILTLAASVAAFGGGVSFPEIGAAYLVAFAIGTVAPTPGGLGPVEFALVAALSGYGMASGPAVSAVLTFRLATFWLPMVPGWFMFQLMQRREEL
jgi:glycosyltransferase 2 family protein